jgi:hypothetical protein
MYSVRRNVSLLAACQAMLLTNNSTLIAINALAGLALAPMPGSLRCRSRAGYWEARSPRCRPRST